MNALRVLKPLLLSAAWCLHVAIVLVSDYISASNVRKAFPVFVSLIASFCVAATYRVWKQNQKHPRSVRKQLEFEANG